MSERGTTIRIADLPTWVGVVMLIVSVLVASWIGLGLPNRVSALEGYAASKEDVAALEKRVTIMEANQRFLVCRAVQQDEGLDVAPCRYLLQTDPRTFLPGGIP